MSTAKLKVTFAGPLVSIQDAGRFAKLRYGVPASGPMDRTGFAAAHAALGRRTPGPAIEVSLGGLAIECVEGSVTCAVAGGGFRVTCGATTVGAWTVQTLTPGTKLTLRAGDWGSWCYLAFAGQMKTINWLGSAATHALSGFGGGSLKAGDMIEVSDTAQLDARLGDFPCPDLACPTDDVQVVVGPQDHHFEAESVAGFLSDTYALTDAFDRMGVRLSGPKLILKDALSIPSEPIVRGAVQVAGDGVPTVLLADHQTTGGYPKIAVVLSGDVDRLVQNRAGANLRFRALPPEQAIAAARKNRADIAVYLQELAKPRATLEQRLMQENLISGAIDAQTDDRAHD